MKKLFFIFLFFTVTVFTSQIVKPMEPIEPPKMLLIEPNFECELRLNSQRINMVKLKYEIKSPDKKLSPSTPPNTFDTTFITIKFTPDGGVTNVACILKNINARASDQHLSTNTFRIFLNNIMLNQYLFQAQMFNRPDMIKALIEITLDAYLREHVSTLKNCIICSHRIIDRKPAVFLKCGYAVHKKCYKKYADDAECPTCGQNLTNDFWCKLKALPKCM